MKDLDILNRHTEDTPRILVFEVVVITLGVMQMG